MGPNPITRPLKTILFASRPVLLRKKLAEYFATEGRAEPLVLTIPKGSYVPVFNSRNPGLTSADLPVATDEEIVFPEPQPSAEKPRLRESLTAWRVLSGVLALACICLAIGLGARNGQPASSAPAALSPLSKQLIDGNHRTYVVCADAALALSKA